MTNNLSKVYEAVENSVDYAYLTKEENPEIYSKLNFGGRPKSVNNGHLSEPVINTLVFGYTRNATATYELFTAQRGLSAHYLIDRDGKITQMVDPVLRAWFAGYGSWDGHKIHDGKDCVTAPLDLAATQGFSMPICAYLDKPSISLNDNAIGVYLEYNDGGADRFDGFSKEVTDAAIGLAGDLVAAYNIQAANILSYDDGRIDQKTGLHVEREWNVLLPFVEFMKAGIGLYSKAFDYSGAVIVRLGDTGVKVQCVQAQLQKFGYKINTDGVFDDATHDVVRVFDKHFSQSEYKRMLGEEFVFRTCVNHREMTSAESSACFKAAIGALELAWSVNNQMILTDLLQSKFDNKYLVVVDCANLDGPVEADVVGRYVYVNEEL